MHQDPDGNILINKDEDQIAILLNAKLQHAFESCKFTDESTTYLPFYDNVIDQSKKNMLGEVKVAEKIREKVKSIALRSLK